MHKQILLCLICLTGALRAQTPTPKLSPSTVQAETVNEALGVPLFPTDGSLLWNAAPADLAQRLNLPEKSNRSDRFSFNTTQFSRYGMVVCSNYLDGTETNTTGVFLGIDVLNITKTRQTLDHLFGPSSGTLTLENAFETCEQGDRWDWPDQQASFLLVTIDKNYTAMRILPTSSLSQITSNKEVQERAKTDISNRIQRNPSNGDVLLEFPIVNHSPSKKVEQLRSDELITLYRQLRYFGVETDLSFLTYSTRNHTTDEVVRELLANVGVCWHSEEVVISLGQVKINIDAGQPLIFSMYDSKELDDRIIQRSEDRKKITDWVQWKNSLLKKTPDSKSVADWSQWKTDLLKYRNFHVIGSQRHMSYATIIGYNDDTREIAFSTPNNIYEPVIWLTEEEIRAIADGNASY